MRIIHFKIVLLQHGTSVDHIRNGSFTQTSTEFVRNSDYARVTCIPMLGMDNGTPFAASYNVRYYHNKELKEWTEGARIRQIFLSPYSPNLNLIEQFWKFLRKKIIYTGYRTEEKFMQAIVFFDNIEIYKEELDSLLTLKYCLCNSKNISF